MPSKIATTSFPANEAAQATQPDTETDDSLIPIFTSTAAEDVEGIEDDDDEDAAGEAGEAGEDNASQPVSLMKRKNKSKGIMARGPTALPKNRGNGFEGTISLCLESTKEVYIEREQSILRIRL